MPHLLNPIPFTPRWSLLIALVLILLAVPSLAQDAAAETAPAGESAASDVETLRARAKEYWAARVTRSPEALKFYAPVELGGPKRAKDVSEFGNIGYKSWEIQRVDVNGDEAVVRIAIQADFPLPAPKAVVKNLMTRTLHEEWLKVEGTWYKRPIPRGFSHAVQAAEKARDEKLQAEQAEAQE